MEVYYTSLNGEREGRASRFYKSKDAAESKLSKQNGMAEYLGVKSRYVLVSTPDKGIESKEIVS